MATADGVFVFSPGRDGVFSEACDVEKLVADFRGGKLAAREKHWFNDDAYDEELVLLLMSDYFGNAQWLRTTASFWERSLERLYLD